ncbi:MAG TPA: hypothetical protein VGB45_14630 [Abditibacterium sp.]|jgi:hypothetical protein
MKQPKITGLDLLGSDVQMKNEGALYQVVEGDTTNDVFKETIQKGAEEWAQGLAEEKS